MLKFYTDLWEIQIVQQFAVPESILAQQYGDIWCALQTTVQVKLQVILSCRSLATLHHDEFTPQATAMLLKV